MYDEPPDPEPNPCPFCVLDSRVFGGHGQVLVAHPSIVARLKKLSETFDRDQRL